MALLDTTSLSRQHYPQLLRSLLDLPKAEQYQTYRYLARTDLWYLIRYLLNRSDMEQTDRMGAFCFSRTREVQSNPDGRLDLWARGHYKSSIITFGLTIQELLAGYGEDPIGPVREPTICIHSHTRGIAKAFLRQIKYELQGNDALKALFPDILYAKPERDAPKWSEDDGLVLRRKGNPKESSLEAWGLVDGQPTSRHYSTQIYDDVVAPASVTTPDMVHKTNEAWEMSLNLGSIETRRRYIGTRYAFMDTWAHIIKQARPDLRIYPATDDGTPAGEPVMLTRVQFETRWREMGPYTGASQLMQNPVADAIAGFKRDWLRYYDTVGEAKGMNRYILVDPASEKKKGSDYTVIWVWGLGSDENMYLLDVVRDRLNLKERINRVMDMHRKWHPKRVGYEKYGMQADVEYLKEVQRQDNYRFDVTEVGGTQPKNDRIRRLVPYASEGRVYLPRVMIKADHTGKVHDLINVLIEEEMMAFPVGIHDDMLDAASRLFDIEHVWPRGRVVEQRKEERYGRRQGTTWMSR